MTSAPLRSLSILCITTVLANGTATAQELLPAVDFVRGPSWAGEFWPGDFDRDGRTDLAVRDLNSGVVTIALGTGEIVASATQGWPRAAADVNRDGFLDVLAHSGTRVVVLPGNGDGTLGAPRTVLEVHPTFVRVADMDGDGHRDVVIGEEGESLHVVPGNGDLTFRPAVTMTTGFWPHGATVADFNGDDRPDIAVAHRYDRRLVIFRNDGGLLFAASDIALDHSSSDVTARDLDGDGRLDLIVSLLDPSDGNFGFQFGAVDVFAGNGDATFGPPRRYPAMAGPVSLAVGDFTHDGRLDVATTNGPQFRSDNTCGREFGPHSLSILPGTSDGGFGPPTSFALESGSPLDAFGTLNTADFDGDGRVDLLAGSGYVLLSRGLRRNNPPLVDAGNDHVIRNTNQIGLSGRAIDPDNHYLTYSWSDGAAGGTFYAPRLLETCYEPPSEGVFTLTLSADDGHGGVASDSLNVSYVPSEDGFDWTGSPVFEATGSVTYEDATYTVTGSGQDIWGDEDEFYFVNVQVRGDFDFTAHVTSVENVHRWTKAGLMIRRDLATGSPHVSLFATPTSQEGLAFQRRLEPEGQSLHTSGPAIAPPVWLRLSRRGATVTAFYRRTETAPWTAIGSDSLAPTDFDRVGLAVTSHVDASTLATARFEQVAFGPVDRPPDALPSSWSSRDIGAVGAAGSASFNGTTFTVRGSGADIWGTADEFHYASTEVSGDFEMTAHVLTVENIDRWTKAGVMIRETLAAGARHASIFATPTTEKPVAFQRRPVANGTSVHTAGPSNAPPIWFKLARTGDVITASYRTAEGEPWRTLGTQELPGLADSVHVGLAVSSHVDGLVAAATFENVTLAAPDEVPSGLPEGWSCGDIGAVGQEGACEYDPLEEDDSSDGWIVWGSGADIWGTADEFSFAGRQVTGDFAITARVGSVDNVDRWTKAGIMIRDWEGESPLSANAGARHASFFVTPTTAKGTAFQRRTVQGGTSVHTAGPAATAPVWLRLTRTGNVIRAFFRKEITDAWTLVGTQSFSGLPDTLSAMIVVSSHVDGTLASAEFSSVTVDTLHAMQSVDIGTTAAGSTASNTTTLTIEGNGADIWGTADAFRFHYVRWSGNGTITARVHSLENTHAWAKAGVMFRETLDPHSKHVMAIVSPGRGLALQYRSSTGGLSASTTPVPGAAPAWISLRRFGDQFQAGFSPDGEFWTWHSIGDVTLPMNADVFVGLPVTSHSSGTLATAVFDDVVIRP